MDPGQAKRTLNEQFARIGKVVAHPKRIELLDLLAQSERSVDSLAAATSMTVSNTSAQLQVLRQARLVESRKAGTYVLYRISGDDVVAFVDQLRGLAAARLAEVTEVTRDYFDARDELEPISRDELTRLAHSRAVVVVDVRPHSEYTAGHIPRAVSIPLDELEAHVNELPVDADIVAYCRGPYCVLAVEAVALLRQRGRRARRLADGLPEWRSAGLPVAISSTG
jgi:rhodanese-related sulfurtransferase